MLLISLWVEEPIKIYQYRVIHYSSKTKCTSGKLKNNFKQAQTSSKVSSEDSLTNKLVAFSSQPVANPCFHWVFDGKLSCTLNDSLLDSIFSIALKCGFSTLYKCNRLSN